MREQITASTPLSNVTSASPRHSLLTPMGKELVSVALSSGYLTPRTVTPWQASVSDSSESEQPARSGTVTLTLQEDEHRIGIIHDFYPCPMPDGEHRRLQITE